MGSANSLSKMTYAFPSPPAAPGAPQEALRVGLDDLEPEVVEVEPAPRCAQHRAVALDADDAGSGRQRADDARRAPRAEPEDEHGATACGRQQQQRDRERVPHRAGGDAARCVPRGEGAVHAQRPAARPHLHLDPRATTRLHATATLAPEARAAISGGRRIDGWKQEGELWVVDIPEAQEGAWSFSSLWANGERRQPARTPNPANPWGDNPPDSDFFRPSHWLKMVGLVGSKR